MVVDREDLGRAALVEPLLRTVHDQADGLARLLVGQVLFDHLGTAAGIDQVIEARAVDAVCLHEVEDVVDLFPVVLVDREAQADLDARILGVLEALERRVEGALHAAETVVGFGISVERDADVGQADLGEAACELGRDQSTVGGDDDAHAAVLRMLHELDQIGAHARLAEIRQIVDHGFGLFGGKLVVAFRVGKRVAMLALEVAGTRAVPDDDRLLVLGELEQAAREFLGHASIAQDIGGLDGAAVQLGDSDHRWSFRGEAVSSGEAKASSSVSTRPGMV